jgi:hypothetical protein
MASSLQTLSEHSVVTGSHGKELSLWVQQAVLLKWAHFMLYDFYHNEADFKKPLNPQ